MELIDKCTCGKRLSERPEKDGLETCYSCGVQFLGSWSSRLKQHEEFCKTTLGQFILASESQAQEYARQAVTYALEQAAEKAGSFQIYGVSVDKSSILSLKEQILKDLNL